MSDAIAQIVSVAALVPATPFIVCDSPFLHTLAVVERDAAHLAITGVDTAQAAATMLQRLTTAGTRLESVRQTLKAPLLAKGREIDAAAAAPAGRIEATKNLLKKKVADYDTEQRRLLAEAERARQAEIKRLQALAAAEEAERRRKADELAAQLAASAAASKKPVFEFEDDDPVEPAPQTATEKALGAVMAAPAVIAEKPAGIAYRVALLIDSADVAKLPEMFLLPREVNEVALRATFCRGWKENDPIPECPGVAFRVQRTVVATGKDQF